MPFLGYLTENVTTNDFGITSVFLNYLCAQGYLFALLHVGPSPEKKLTYSILHMLVDLKQIASVPIRKENTILMR